MKNKMRNATDVTRISRTKNINKRLHDLLGSGLLNIGPWGCAFLVAVTLIVCAQLYVKLSS